MKKFWFCNLYNWCYLIHSHVKEIVCMVIPEPQLMFIFTNSFCWEKYPHTYPRTVALCQPRNAFLNLPWNWFNQDSGGRRRKSNFASDMRTSACKHNPLIRLTPGSLCTKSLWAHNSNLVPICAAITLEIMIRSGHNFAHVTTAQLSWHVQNCGLADH